MKSILINLIHMVMPSPKVRRVLACPDYAYRSITVCDIDIACTIIVLLRSRLFRTVRIILSYTLLLPTTSRNLRVDSGMQGKYHPERIV